MDGIENKINRLMNHISKYPTRYLLFAMPHASTEKHYFKNCLVCLLYNCPQSCAFRGVFFAQSMMSRSNEDGPVFTFEYFLTLFPNITIENTTCTIYFTNVKCNFISKRTVWVQVVYYILNTHPHNCKTLIYGKPTSMWKSNAYLVL